jgi:hypothetical protein
MLHGQEVEPQWDPHETGELTLDWQTILLGLLVALGFCGLWRFFIWFLESRRERIHWRAARYLWPTAMLAWGWTMAVLDLEGVSRGPVFDSIFVIYALANLPALIVLIPVLRLCAQLAIWQSAIIASIAMWAASYLIVRLAEWRAWLNAPISLHIADQDTGTAHLS